MAYKSGVQTNTVGVDKNKAKKQKKQSYAEAVYGNKTNQTQTSRRNSNSSGGKSSGSNGKNKSSAGKGSHTGSETQPEIQTQPEEEKKPQSIIKMTPDDYKGAQNEPSVTTDTAAKQPEKKETAQETEPLPPTWLDAVFSPFKTVQNIIETAQKMNNPKKEETAGTPEKQGEQAAQKTQPPVSQLSQTTTLEPVKKDTGGKEGGAGTPSYAEDVYGSVDKPRYTAQSEESIKKSRDEFTAKEYDRLMGEYGALTQDDAFWNTAVQGSYSTALSDRNNFTTDEQTYLNYLMGSGDKAGYGHAQAVFGRQTQNEKEKKQAEEAAALANSDSASQSVELVSQIDIAQSGLNKEKETASGKKDEAIKANEEWQAQLKQLSAYGDTQEVLAARAECENAIAQNNKVIANADAQLKEIDKAMASNAEVREAVTSSPAYATKTAAEYQADKESYERKVKELQDSLWGQTPAQQAETKRKIEEYQGYADEAEVKWQVANNQELNSKDRSRLKALTSQAIDPAAVAAGKEMYERDRVNNTGLYNPFEGGTDLVTGKDLSAAGQASQEDRDRWYQLYYQNGGDTKGWNAANEYYNLIEDDLNAKAGQYQHEVISNMDDGLAKNIAVLGNAGASGLETFINNVGQIGDVIRGDTRGRQAGANTQAGELIRPELEGGMGTVYDVVQGIAGTAPAIVLGSVNPIFGVMVIGTDAAGGAINHALREGKKVNEAVTYGVMSAAVEGALTAAIGGFSKLGGVSRLTEGLLSKVDDAVSKFAGSAQGRLIMGAAARQAVASGGQFTVGALRQFVEPVLRNVIFDENNDVKAFTAEQMYAGMLGTVSSMVYNSIPAMQETQKMINRKAAADRVFRQLGFAPKQDGTHAAYMQELMRADYADLSPAKKATRAQAIAGLLTGKVPEGLRGSMGLSQNPIVARAQVVATRTKTGLGSLLSREPLPELITPEGVRLELTPGENTGMAFDKTGGSNGNTGGGVNNEGSGIIGEQEINKAPDTKTSVTVKLKTYLLDKTHVKGGSKAKWFEQALGFNQDNMDGLAKQIVFDPDAAIQTKVTEFGVKYNQIIRITGANGKVIDVTFAWIKNNDGIIRLVTVIPTKKM